MNPEPLLSVEQFSDFTAICIIHAPLYELSAFTHNINALEINHEHKCAL